MKKILIYVATYILATLITAFSVVLIANPYSQLNASGNTEVEQSGPINKIAENAMQLNSLKINADTTIQKDSTPFLDAQISANLTMDEGFTNIKCDGKIDLTPNSSSNIVNTSTILQNTEENSNITEIQFSYLDKTLYLSAFGASYKLNVSSISKIIPTITGLFNSYGLVLPDLSSTLGIDINNLDTSTIMGMFSSIQEEKINDDEIKLTLPLGDLGNIILITDNSYMIKNIDIPNLSIKNYNLKINSNLDYPSDLTIETPTINEYVDLTDFSNLIEPLSSLLCNKKISLNTFICYNDYKFNFITNVDRTNDLKISINGNLDKEINLTYIDKEIYLSYENISAKCSTQNAISLFNILKEKISNLSKDNNDIKNLQDKINFNNIQNKDLATILKETNIDYVEKIELVDNKYILTLKGLGQVIFTLNNTEITTIEYIYNNLDITINALALTNDITLKENNYVDLDNSFETLKSLINFADYKSISGDAILNIKDNLINIDYTLNYSNSLSLKLLISYNDITSSIYFINNKIYLSIKDINVIMDKDNLSKLIPLIINKFNISINSDDLINKLKYYINKDNYQNLLKTFEYNNNCLSITLFDNTTIKIENTNELISTINIVNNDYSFKTSITESQEISPIIIENLDSYIDLANITETLQNLDNYLTNKEYYLSCNLKYKNYNLSGFVNYSNDKIEAKLDGTICNVNLSIIFYNDKLYITANNLKLVGTINDFNSLMSIVSKNFNLDKILVLPTINKDTIIKVIKDSTINLTKNGLTLSYDGINLSINTVSNNIISINASLNDYSFDLIKCDNKTEINIINDEEYIKISDLIKLSESLINTVNNNTWNINGNLLLNNNKIDYDINLKLNKSLTIQGKLTYKNETIFINVLNDTIYLSYKNIYAKFNLEDSQKLINIINDKFNTNIDYSTIKKYYDLIKNYNFEDCKNYLISNLLNNTSAINIDSLLQQDISNIINNIKISILNNNYTIKYDDYNATIITNNEKIESIKLNKDDNINIILNMSNAKFETFSIDNYIDLSNCLDTLNSALNTINYSSITGYIKLSYKDYTFDINYTYNIKDNELKLIVNYNDIIATIIYKNNIIYLNVKDIKVYVNISDIKVIINNIIEEFNLPKDTTTKINDTITNTLNGNFVLISEFNKVDDSLVIRLYNNLEITITSSNNLLSKISLIYNDISLSGTINENNESQIILAPDTSDYVNAKNTADLITNIHSLIISNNINATFDGVVYGYNVSGLINYNNNKLSVYAKSTIYGKTIEVWMIDNIIYANVDTLGFSFNINNLQTLLTFINDEFNYNLTDKLNVSITQSEILSIIKESKINYNNDKISLDVCYSNNKVSVNVNLSNNNIDNITISGFNSNVNIVKIDSALITLPQNKNWLDINTTLPIIKSVYKTYLDKAINGTFDLNLNILGSTTKVNGNYAISYLNNNLKVYVRAELKGIYVELDYADENVYIDINGIKLFASTNDFDDIIKFINDNFNTQITLPNMNENINIESIINKISLSVISSIISTNNDIKVTFSNNDYFILNVANNKITSVYFTFGVNNGNIYITKYGENVVISEVEKSSYIKYDNIANIIKAIKTIYDDKKFKVSANTVVFNGDTLRFSGNLGLTANLNNGLEINAFGHLTGENKYDVSLDYYNKYLFVNFNGLKLKIEEEHIKEFLVVGAEFFGIDPNVIPILQDTESKIDVNIKNLSTLMPNIDFSDPLSILAIVKSFTYDNDSLIIKLDGSKISTNPNAKDMELKINCLDGKLNNVSLTNIFTGVTNNEFFNLDINFTTFDEIVAPTNENKFIDISSSIELVKAFINTAELDNYHIQIPLNVNLNLPVLGTISIAVNIDVKVQLDENRKPTIIAVIGPIPVVTGLNNDVPYKFGDTVNLGSLAPGKDRILTIYIKDGYTYLYRTEQVPVFPASYRTYEKKLMISNTTLFNEPLYYLLQYGAGFKDNIMTAINEAIEKSKNRTSPIDMGNVLISYTNNASSGSYTIVLNMKEISNNPDLDTMTLTLFVTNDSTTNNKNYITKATFNLHMPLSSASVIIDLDSQNIKLIDIGKTLDFSSCYNYINNYPYVENAYYSASNGDWTLDNGTYTLTFVENGGSDVNDITAVGTTEITLPTYETKVVDDGKTQTTTRFCGWYANSDLTGEAFTSNRMPIYNTTLYAKWETTVIYYRTITFNGGVYGNIDSIKQLSGTNLNLPTFTDNIKKTINNTTTTYSFDNYYLESDFVNKFNATIMPDYDLTLYAKWNIVSVETTYNLIVYDNDSLVLNERIKPNEIVSMPTNIKIDNYTLWFLDNLFTNEYNNVSNNLPIMPNNDLTIYIRNKYNVSVSSNYGTIINDNYYIYQGAEFSYPSQSSYIEDNNITQTTYTFLGYFIGDSITNIINCPNKDTSIVAKWNVVTKKYCTVTFNVSWVKPSPWIDKNSAFSGKITCINAPTKVNPLHILEGTVIYPTNYNSTCKYSYQAVWITDSYDMKVVAWNTSGTKNVLISKIQNSSYDTLSELTINNDTTLYATWGKA
jgi:hypothetical protein